MNHLNFFLTTERENRCWTQGICQLITRYINYIINYAQLRVISLLKLKNYFLSERPIQWALDLAKKDFWWFFPNYLFQISYYFMITKYNFLECIYQYLSLTIKIYFFIFFWNSHFSCNSICSVSIWNRFHFKEKWRLQLII